MNDIVRAQRPIRLPVVLSREEVASLLTQLRGPVWLMASLMYGAGLRLLECAELRVKDLNFDRGEVTVRNGKGGKDRVTMLPAALKGPLRDHLAVGLSGDTVLRRSDDSRAPTASLTRVRPAAGRERGGPGSRNFASCHVPFAPAQFRDPSARGRLRHPNHPGAARASRREYDDDLYGRSESRRSRGPEPARPTRTKHLPAVSRYPATPAGDSRYRVLPIQALSPKQFHPSTHGRWASKQLNRSRRRGTLRPLFNYRATELNRLFVGPLNDTPSFGGDI